MKTIIVASNNPVKIDAVREGFTRMFPGEGFTVQAISVPSGVSAQPFSDEETLRGAFNRAQAARESVPEADFWAGVEGGVEYAPDYQNMHGGAIDVAMREMCAYAWIVILSPDRVGKGRTGVFYLPPRVADLVAQGIELGEADDLVFGRSNSKQANGAVGLLTADLIDRAAYYAHAVILALIPFKNPALYAPKGPEF